MNTPLSLKENIIYMCGEFSHQFHKALTEVFRERGITITVEQFAILALLYYKDGLHQQDISEQLNRDKTTIARVLTNMEKNKLLTRVTDKEDNRGKLIYLTRKGSSVQQKAVEASAALYEKCLSSVRKEEVKAGLSVLLKMTHALS